MTGRYLILFLSLEIFVLRCYSQNISNDDRLRQIVKQYGQVEVTVTYSDNQTVDILTRNISILSVKDNLIHISLSPVTVDWFVTQKFDYQIIARVNARSITSAASLNQAMKWEQYPTYSQYDSIMQSFRTLYPTLCRVDTIGKSVNGKLILALKISDNAASDENEPKVFYSSSIHGDETGGFILMLRLADFLLKNYNISSRVKNLVDNLEIWINPLANPDGTYKSGNTISVVSTRFNANGVDLNRNFPDAQQPFEIQQKETLAMMKFMSKHRFALSANFHSGTEVVNYPWDKWPRVHADDAWFREISRKYADTVHLYSAPGYMTFLENGVTNGYKWYPVYGGRQDFMTYELRGREVTIELDNQYITPVSQLALLWSNNWHSLIGYLENALYGIHGRVINSLTAAPVSANVFIKGHDADNSNVFSDTLTGNFTRFLAPGNWDLTFSAIGYRDTTINNLIIHPLEKTEIIVKMVSLENKSIIIYPNPAVSELKAILPSLVSGTVNIRIINQSGMIISDYNAQVAQNVPIVIDIQKLSAGLYTIIFSNTGQRISCKARFIVIK